MKLTNKQLRAVYDSTSGRCHLCHKKLAFKNYGSLGARAAWEVDHSRPRAQGGTDHGNNLKPSCQSCNRSKGTASSRSVRTQNGHTRAPRSRAAIKRTQGRNRLIGAGTGAALGFRVGGPVGLLLGVLAGALLGENFDEGK